MRHFSPDPGTRIGHLTVIQSAGPYVTCDCDCGNRRTLKASELTRRTSCGCSLGRKTALEQHRQRPLGYQDSIPDAADAGYEGMLTDGVTRDVEAALRHIDESSDIPTLRKLCKHSDFLVRIHAGRKLSRLVR